ncbi:DUF6049 family protein [Flindersiella endophytica]
MPLSAFAALFSLVMALGLVVGTPAQPAFAAPEGASKTVLDSITPTVSPATKSITVSGRVINTGKLPLDNVVAYFWFSRDGKPLTTPAQIAEEARKQPRLEEKTDHDGRLTWPGGYEAPVTDELQPGATARFTLTVPVSVLREKYKDQAGALTPGIYVAGADVRGTPSGWSKRVMSSSRTFQPWLPAENKLTPVEVAFLLPMAAKPDVVSTSDRELLDDNDTKLFGRDGRLSKLLDLGAAHNLSYLVDPALLEKAQVMSNPDGYTVGSRRYPGSAEALAWLEKARGLLATHDTLMLPYADPDVAALTHNKLTGSFGAALQESNAAAGRFETSGTTITWPGTGYADNATLEAIAGADGSNVLLSRSALPGLKADGTNPTAALVAPSKGLTALVYDPALTAAQPGVADNPVFTQQRFLAETALLALQGASPDGQRRVVAALPRDWNPGGRESALFDAVDSMPWLRTVSANAVLSGAPSAYGRPAAYPASQRKAELGEQTIGKLRTLSKTNATYLDVLTDGADRRSELQLSFARAASTAWRSDETRNAALINALEADISSQIGRIRLVKPSIVTMSSDSGRFPLTVSNGNRDLTVQVALEIKPQRPVLTIEPTDPVNIVPLRRQTIRVTAEANSSDPGATLVKARVVTPNGTPITDWQTFTVRVEGYGQIGWGVIGVGLGLLCLATVLRIFRRIRAAVRSRRQPAANLSEAGEKPAEPDGSTNGRVSSPVLDGPQPPKERV